MFRRQIVQAAHNRMRSLSSISMPKTNGPLRVGYIPEHFSTPLAFAHQNYQLNAELIPEPLGTGALTSHLKENRMDIAIGLTEGFVADLGKTPVPAYGLVGTYVSSPLCWAIVTGAQRSGIASVQDLKAKRVGVSRLGSGSYVMSYVLADQQGWLGNGEEPFDVVVAGDFASLRSSVREEGPTPSDFFMWEHFTTRKFWTSAPELKNVGEIYTPWASWMIAARNELSKEQLEDFMRRVNAGVKKFKEVPEEAVRSITERMHYSEADAREWMQGVVFPDDVRGVEGALVEKTVAILRKAGVLKEGDGTEAANMISFPRR